MDMKFIEENLQKYKDEIMKIYEKSQEKILKHKEIKKENINLKNKNNQQKKTDIKRQNNENKKNKYNQKKN